MISFYKLCIRRFGFLLGHAIFIFVFGFIAGIFLLYLTGGVEHVSFQPLVVWKNLIAQWNYWFAKKDQLGSDYTYRFIGALIAPLVFGFAIKTVIRLISWPFRQAKKRKEALKPKPVTTEERLANIEAKLDKLNENGKTAEDLQESEKETPAQPTESAATNPSPSEEITQQKNAESSKNEQPAPQGSHLAQPDEVIITPPPPAKGAQAEREDTPPSVGADFLSQKRVLNPNKDESGQN